MYIKGRNSYQSSDLTRLQIHRATAPDTGDESAWRGVAAKGIWRHNVRFGI